ncbi:transposase [Ensifer sp. IC3342]|nr:transposase [Ensifer sp. BRP08]MCA1451539.1 transposase [Ensifer sp. IC3342]
MSSIDARSFIKIINTIKSSGCPESDGGMHYEAHCAGLIKVIWHDGIGLSLYAKRLERGRFIWPATEGGAITLTAGQMSYLLEGIDWRHPQQTWRPTSAG